jgi:hypothetical protein
MVIPYGVLKKISTIAPSATGETIMGNSRIVSTSFFPKKLYLDSAYAEGTAKNIEKTVATVAVAMLRRMENKVLSEKNISKKK